MSGIALYFGKVNMVSSELNSVLNNETSLRRILDQVSQALNDRTTYTYDRPLKIDDEYTSEEILYSISIKEKDL